MSESVRGAIGRKVVSRATAHQLGTVAHLLLSADGRQVAAIVVGKGKKAQLIDWAALTGFGADAVMVGDESALRPPADDRERAAAAGKLEVVGRRTLSELGNELGSVADVTFDPQSGAVELVLVEGQEAPAEAVLGSGTYAVVLAAALDGHDRSGHDRSA
jgi:uncharacterized protein YrrD